MIKLYDGFYIESDSMNYMLKEEYIATKEDGTKETKVRIHGYPVSVQNCLKMLKRVEQRRITEEQVMTLNEATREFNKIDDRIEKLALTIKEDS